MLQATHHHPPPHNFKHEGGVPQQNSKVKNILEWSSLLVHKKRFQLDSKRKDMDQSTMIKENIMKLTCCTITKMLASRIDKFSACAYRLLLSLLLPSLGLDLVNSGLVLVHRQVGRTPQNIFLPFLAKNTMDYLFWTKMVF